MSIEWAVCALIVVSCVNLVWCWFNYAVTKNLERDYHDLGDSLARLASKKADAPGDYDRFCTERFVLNRIHDYVVADFRALLEHLNLQFVNEGRKLVPRKPPES